jgi:C-terminal processing protease CtpA/Prc
MGAGCLMVCLIMAAFSASAAGKAGTPTRRLTIEARQMPLGELIAEIESQSAVVVTGLEDRYGERVSFMAREEPAEDALKRLLQQLDERNYALVFNRTHLTRVSVFPPAKRNGPQTSQLPEAGTPPKPTPRHAFRAVRITKVHEGTQAQDHGMKTGDLIIEYDGKRILKSQDLVAAVKEKGPDQAVEMVLVRNRRPIRMVLNGGLIGINVISVAVPPEEAGQ